MSRGFSVKTQFPLAVGPLIKGSLTSTFQQLSYSKASQYHVEISTFKGAIVSMPIACTNLLSIGEQIYYFHYSFTIFLRF